MELMFAIILQTLGIEDPLKDQMLKSPFCHALFYLIRLNKTAC